MVLKAKEQDTELSCGYNESDEFVVAHRFFMVF